MRFKTVSMRSTNVLCINDYSFAGDCLQVYVSGSFGSVDIAEHSNSWQNDFNFWRPGAATTDNKSIFNLLIATDCRREIALNLHIASYSCLSFAAQLGASRLGGSQHTLW